MLVTGIYASLKVNFNPSRARASQFIASKRGFQMSRLTMIPLTTRAQDDMEQSVFRRQVMTSKDASP